MTADRKTVTPRPILLSLVALALLTLAACGPEAPDTATIQGTPIQERQVDGGQLTLGGDPAYDGPAAVACAPVGHGEHGGLRFELAPAGLPSVAVEIEVHELHGAGTYDAEIRLLRDDGGSYRTSEGHGRASLRTGTEMSRDTATRWVTAEIDGEFAGAAGDGELDASFERCFYFG